MFFNKDMTDAAGINPPEVLTGWTMEEALPNWQKTVQRDGSSVTVWGLRWGQGTYWGDYEHGIVRRAAGPKGSPTNMGMAPDGVTFKGYMDTPEALAAFEFQRSWYRGENPVSPQEPIPDIFFNKQSAFYISPDNAIGTINRKYPNGDFRFGVMGIPGFANGSQVCHTDSWHFGVSPASKQQDLAAALVKYMTGPEGAKIWFGVIKQLPARTELLNTVPEYKEMPQKLFAEAVQAYGQPRIGTPGYTEYQQVFAELMTNGGNPQTIVEQRGLQQVSNADELRPMIANVIAANADKATQYRGGKTGLLGFFVGQAMRQIGGKANPQVVQALVHEMLAA
jgi:ABC-type glycerol-3-phosphate transport system substrate-binding protein